MLLAGDVPILGKASTPLVLDGTAVATLDASNITSTAEVRKVWAVITDPSPVAGTCADVNSRTVSLVQVDGSVYRCIAGVFTSPGEYEIAFYASDGGGGVSLPVNTVLTQLSAAPRPFPPDVNIDGQVDAIDIQMTINGALGRPTGVITDVNDDGATGAIDVQIVISAALT